MDDDLLGVSMTTTSTKSQPKVDARNHLCVPPNKLLDAKSASSMTHNHTSGTHTHVRMHTHETPFCRFGFPTDEIPHWCLRCLRQATRHQSRNGKHLMMWYSVTIRHTFHIRTNFVNVPFRRNRNKSDAVKTNIRRMNFVCVFYRTERLFPIATFRRRDDALYNARPYVLCVCAPLGWLDYMLGTDADANETISTVVFGCIAVHEFKFNCLAVPFPCFYFSFATM